MSTFEALRISCQCPEKLARQLFDECARLRVELAIAQTAHALEQALRAKAEAKLAAASAPRRTYRKDEEK